MVKIGYQGLIRTNYQEPMPGDHERRRWQHVPEDIAGRVLDSEEGLASLGICSEEQEFRIMEREFTMFGNHVVYYIVNRKTSRGWPVAYGCGHCGKVVVGPPRIEDHDSQEPSGAHRGYSARCTNCSAAIKTLDEEI